MSNEILHILDRVSLKRPVGSPGVQAMVGTSDTSPAFQDVRRRVIPNVPYLIVPVGETGHDIPVTLNDTERLECHTVE